MGWKSITAVALIGIFGLTGCGAMHERRWGWCAVGGGVVGAAVGAGTAGGLVNAYEKGRTDEETGAAAGAGAVGGGLLGALIGHMLCDPTEEAPPPPPPPPAPAPPPVHKKISLAADTYFDFNKAVLKPEGKQKVDEVVSELKANPSIRVLVEGHTDSIGSEAYNQKLSERRAAAVADYMESRGVEASRITTKGWGKTKPVASNKTKEGRAQNRRVEITED
jgi:OOP family OmpA-OmpF porin